MQKKFTYNGKKYIAKSGNIGNHAAIHIFDENNNYVGIPLVGGTWDALSHAVLGYSQTRLLQTGGASEKVMIERLIDAWIFDFTWRQKGGEHRWASAVFPSEAEVPST